MQAAGVGLDMLSAPVLWLAFAIVSAAACFAFVGGRARSLAVAGTPDAFVGRLGLHSLPNYYGYYAAVWTMAPALAVLIAGLLFQGRYLDGVAAEGAASLRSALSGFQFEALTDSIRRLARGDVGAMAPSDPSYPVALEAARRVAAADAGYRLALAGLTLVVAAAGFFYARNRIAPAFRARNKVERFISIFLIASASIAIATTVGIVFSLVTETFRFFQSVSPLEFFFGLQWSAQTSIRPDQVGASGSFGAVPLFFGTLFISLIAMLVAVPIGLGCAIYLSEYAGPAVRRVVKPVLEVLAGIPTVVYGFFALLTVAPFIRGVGEALNGFLMWAAVDVLGMTGIEGPILAAQPTSALAAGLVMGIMIIPFVSSLSDDVINAVPQSLRDGSYAMGATRSETVRRVILPAALPGIVGAILLAVSRAIGETMIVVMAAGQRAQITANPFSDVTTVTVQIVSLLTGDTEFDSPKTLSAFALGFTLFVVTLGFNFIALRVVQKYREKYD